MKVAAPEVGVAEAGVEVTAPVLDAAAPEGDEAVGSSEESVGSSVVVKDALKRTVPDEEGSTEVVRLVPTGDL